MSRLKIRIAIASVAVLAAVPATASAEFTVTESHTVQDGSRYDVTCNERTTLTYDLPRRAQNVQVLEPDAGDPVTDGFGEARLGTIESVVVNADSVTITVMGGYEACSYPGPWEANPMFFRARYERVLTPKVKLSEEPGGLDARSEPKAITATADAGWSKLRWKDWGERTAVAKGRFYGVMAVDHNGAASLDTFSYPVRVTLTKIRACESGYFYTRLDTKFLRKPPAEIAHQAKVPGVASCLNGG
jgi:hypothetical protein